MRKFGLIGKSLAHSSSKEYFHQKFAREGIRDCVYENFQLDNLKKLRPLVLLEQDLCGLNITTPYKSEVIQYIDAVDAVAEAIQAVNCIKISRDRYMVRLIGYNTDAVAFRETIKPLLKKAHKKALVLGTGGASGAVCHALKDLNIAYTIVSRKEKPGVLFYSGITSRIMADHQVIINATPVGMFPDEGQCPPLPYEALTTGHLLYDLIYNPEESLFLKMGLAAHAQIKNGLEMLHLQAELSWKMWNSIPE